MGKRVKRVSCAVLVFGATALWVCAAGADVKETARTVHELRQQISLLNLVNGLNLTDEQSVRLIEILRAVEAERTQNEPKLQAALDEAQKAFSQLKETLLSGADVPPEISRRASQADHQLKLLEEQKKKRRVEWEKQVSEVLNENQLALIAEFAPCLIPPKRRDESRIGQVSSEVGQSAKLVKMLEHVRSMSKEQFESKKEQLIERGIQTLVKGRGELDPEYRQVARKKLSELLDKSRSLSDVDFNLQKEQLVKEAMPIKGSGQLKPSNPEVGKVGRFLLDPHLLPILEAKRERK